MKIRYFLSTVWAVGTLLLFLAGCATDVPMKTISLAEERKPLLLQPPANSEGSLWATRNNTHYFADVKARNVGDIVTINIVESASASKNAETKTSRASDLEAGWSGVLSKLTGNWVGADQKVSFGNNFDGKGQTTRSSTLNAYITAQVIHVFPNGNLAIQGSRQVQVNNENQYINIQGVIRPADISAANIVLSTFISDAKIELSGHGAVSDKQKPGWLARALDWVWPF
ncbi:MAG: flagellar basal body L-ring protein FlgH [Deltaproteobacteria bacterium]|nr:flagellar basal body L-ring protein FlgH [Deltaproteobacteria bacterium]